jgi:hypothetical protein
VISVCRRALPLFHRRVVQSLERGSAMLRDIILWLAGVPIVVIILLHLLGLLN